MSSLENLAAAVRAVVADHNDGALEPASVADVIALTRREVDHDDIRVLQQADVPGPQLTPEEADAYRQVLDADPDALRDAIFIAEAPAPVDAQGSTADTAHAVAETAAGDLYVAGNLAAARAGVERERASAAREGAAGLVEDALDRVAAELAGLESGREVPPAAAGDAGGAGGAAGDVAGGAAGEWWQQQARRVFAAHLHAAALGNRSLHDVSRWIAYPENSTTKREVRALLGDSPQPAYLPAVIQFQELNNNTRSSITTSIMPALEHLRTEAAADATCAVECAAAAADPAETSSSAGDAGPADSAGDAGGADTDGA